MPNMSSAVIEFSRLEDLKQACYEATVDLNLYLAHLENIAKRCEKNFPETATAIRGCAHGIAQNLHGIDGEWVAGSLEEMRDTLSREEFLNHLWAYNFARDPRAALMLMGSMMAVASVNPELTFWQVLSLARSKLMDLEPLIEQLLKSSPMRNK